MITIIQEAEYTEINTRLAILETAVKEYQKSPSEFFYNNQEFLEIMKVSERTARNWRKDGLIAYSTVEGRIYYKHSDILDLLNRYYCPAVKKKES